MSPRRGRGIDFEHRFNTSRWAEDLLISEFKRHKYLAVRIGLSQVAESNTVEAEKSDIKVPDLLVFSPDHLAKKELSLLQDTDFTEVSSSELGPSGKYATIVEKALCAIEVEFSPYRAKEMGGREWQRRTVDQLTKRVYKHANPPTAPNIFVKDQDLAPLLAWEGGVGVPIVVVHVFDQEAFSIPLKAVENLRKMLVANPTQRINLQLGTGMFLKTQRYDRTDAQGAFEEKEVFCIHPCAATRVGAVENVKVTSKVLLSSSKKYVAHVLFTGGKIDFDDEFLRSITEIRARKQGHS